MTDDDPTPIRTDAAGCLAMVRRHVGQWTPCPAEPTQAGVLVAKPDRRRRYLAFACDQHARHIHDPHPLTETDRAELQHRREQVALALAGQPYERVRPLDDTR